MDSLKLSTLYNQAFELLRQAKEADDYGRDSTSLYMEACKILRAILSVETDILKKQLLFSQLQEYEAKLAELEGSLDILDEEFDPVEPRTVRPQTLNVDTGTTAVKFLSEKCEAALDLAIEEDEKVKNMTQQDLKQDSLQQCIELYVRAAEEYMKLMKNVEKKETEAEETYFFTTRRRLDLILNRIDDLKAGRVSVYTSSEKLDKLMGDLPELPSLPAVASLEIEPHTSRNILPPSTIISPMLTTSPLISSFTDRELNILKQSSFINDRIYQPWLDGEEQRESFRSYNNTHKDMEQQLFCDPDGLLPLSAAQQKAGAVWLRPKEIVMTLNKANFERYEKYSGDTKKLEMEVQLEAEKLASVQAKHQDDAQNSHLGITTLVKDDRGISEKTSTVDIVPENPSLLHPFLILNNKLPPSHSRITQDLVSDCSFVCSLGITAAYEEKFRKQLISKIIFPQNGNNVPIYNPYGKYIVKLYLNGVARKVVIDDRLPFDPVNMKLLCSCSKNPNEFWISLLEKAYLKVNGGYDFPGSNSGIDLYALTGWIPEQVWFTEDRKKGNEAISKTNDDSPKVQDHRQSEERVWARLVSAFQYGDCLVTVSTGSNVEEDSENGGSESGLVSCHAYAVLNIKQAGTLRMLLVKNPWSRRPWKGRFSSKDQNSWTAGLKKVLGMTSANMFEDMDKNGTFWIEYGDVPKYFTSFFLNWNPQLFAFHTTIHDCWPGTQGPRNDTYYVGDNPQYSLIIDPTVSGGKSSSIWILFSRHLTVKEQTESNQSNELKNDVDGSSPVATNGDYFAVHAFRGNGERIFAPSDAPPTIKGIYNNDPHTLLRFDTMESPSGMEEKFTLLLSQINKKRDTRYTISVFSSVQPFRFSAVPPLPPYQINMTGNWNKFTSGGSPKYSTFYVNPQYRLVLGNGDNSSSIKWNMVDIHIQAFYRKEVSALIIIMGRNCYKLKNESVGDNGGKKATIQRYGYRMDNIDDDGVEEAIVAESYRPGFVCIRGRIKCPGTYTVILSTYSPAASAEVATSNDENVTNYGKTIDGKGMIGPFNATFVCSHKCFKVFELPKEGSGYHYTPLYGSWTSFTMNTSVSGTVVISGTAAGCSNFKHYLSNPIFKFQVISPSGVNIVARLQCTAGTSYTITIKSSASSPPTSQDLFPSHQCSPNKKKPICLASSHGGVYNDACCGVTIGNGHPGDDNKAPPSDAESNGPIHLRSGYYCMIPSTFSPNELSTFVIHVYSSGTTNDIKYL